MAVRGRRAIGRGRATTTVVLTLENGGRAESEAVTNRAQGLLRDPSR